MSGRSLKIAVEAIVTKDEWERVQQIIDRRPQKWHEKRTEYDNSFAGLLYCADCGEYMSPRHEFKRGPVDRTTKQPRELMDFIVFDCSTYIRHPIGTSRASSGTETLTGTPDIAGGIYSQNCVLRSLLRTAPALS